jgi:hypothetical protein
MSKIIIHSDRKSDKDCSDWTPLNDGTITGDSKYCNLSIQCKQLGMRSDWYKFRDINGKSAFDYFCTGMYLECKDEGKIDEEVS